MLGKTRQQALTEKEEIFDAKAGRARGVLRADLPAPGKFRHWRGGAPPDLAHWIAHCWMVRWEIDGSEPHPQETLPHPNFHLVFENGVATVAGVHTGKFTRSLAGTSFAFGVKFAPGGCRPFLNAAASSLANKTAPARDVFGDGIDGLLSLAASEEEMAEAVYGFLRPRLPDPDPAITQVGEIVAMILQDRDLKTVDALAARTGVTKRSLQRLFSEYVGVSPKWVIRRYRLHELVERCHSGETLDYPQVALELGYFDQAHLINDFRSIVGYSPAQYQKIAGQSTRKAERRS